MPGRSKHGGRGATRPTTSRESKDSKVALLCGADDIYAGKNSGGVLGAHEIGDRQACPTSVKGSIIAARRANRDNLFVEQLVGTRCDFYNYGLKLVPGAKKATKKERLAIETWLRGSDDGKTPGMEGKVTHLIRRTWEESDTLDNVVALWRDYNAPAWNGTTFSGVQPAFLFRPEECNYSDAFGIEVMKIRYDLTAKEMEERGFPKKAIERYTNGEIALNPAQWGEHFKVLRRAGFEGEGFCWPRLHASYKTLQQAESMEVGEQALALLARRPELRHWIGFEPKVSGMAQSSEKKWKYDDARATKMKKYYKEHPFGKIESVAQFDHKSAIIWVDPKLFEGGKWETIFNRLMWWGGPLAFMFVSKSVSPFLLGMLQARAESDRKLVGPFLEELINRSFRPPFPVKLEWSNQCFKDARLAWDMAKTLMQQGPLSLTTSLADAGYDPEQQAALKKDEAKNERDAELLPKFNPNPPGQKPGTPVAGRQSGVPDNSAPLS